MTNKEAIKNINALNAVCGQKDFYDSEFEEALGVAVDALESQKTGHWIKHENPNLGQCMKISYECSYCKVWLGCEYFVRKSYCPNCGANMKGE